MQHSPTSSPVFLGDVSPSWSYFLSPALLLFNNSTDALLPLSLLVSTYAHVERKKSIEWVSSIDDLYNSSMICSINGRGGKKRGNKDSMI